MSLAHALRANHLKFLLPSCLLQIKYACAMIETGTRHTILICSCTNPEKVADRKGYHTKRKQDSEAILAPMTACSPFECPDCDPSEVGLQDISRQATCLARASQPKKKKRRSPRRPKGLSLPLLLKPQPLTWQLSRHLVWCTPLSTACTLIMLTVLTWA